MRNNKVYNEQTKKLLEEEISNFPGNLMGCFRVVAETIGCSVDTIRRGYYRDRQCPFYKTKMACCFLVISNNSVVNRKSYEPKYSTSTSSIEDKINFILKSYDTKRENN